MDSWGEFGFFGWTPRLTAPFTDLLPRKRNHSIPRLEAIPFSRKFLFLLLLLLHYNMQPSHPPVDSLRGRDLIFKKEKEGQVMFALGSNALVPPKS